MATTAVFPSIPDSQSGGWIAPYYADILQSVQKGQSPYKVILEISQRLYYPSLAKVFQIQLWILVALFSFVIFTILIAIGLRYSQGRLNFFVRLDRTIVLPSSLLFPLCALLHAALGVTVVAGAHVIYHRDPYPIWWIGLKAASIGPLWMGIFFEVWACFAAWYMRKYGPQYRESTLRSSVAFSIPVVLLSAAWIPSIYLFLTASRSFHTSISWSNLINKRLEVWQLEWTPAKGLEIPKLTQLFEPGGELGKALKRYSERSACGSRYVTVVLVVTLMVYLTGASLELNHLTLTIQRLRASTDVVLMPTMSRRSDLSTLAPVTPEPGYQSLEEKLDDDFARGQGKGVRQWRLLEWTRANRILTTVCITLMLVQNAAFQLWKGVTPLTLQTPSAQFQADILVSAWMNSILSSIVAVLILFRSLDGSSPLVTRLKSKFPFLPLPPSLETATSTNSRKGGISSQPNNGHLGRSTPLQANFDGMTRPTISRDRLYSKSSMRTSDESSGSKFGVAA
ncbi:hypothetical protein JCM3765_003185 [Sporobolomyces pararoseus]